MKGFYLSFFLFLSLPSVLFALPVGYGQIRICPGGCDLVTAIDPSDYVFNPTETGAACIAQSSLVQGSVKIYQIYCSGGISEYEGAAAVMQNIVGVPVGTETDQARQAFNTWSFGATPPVCSAEHLDGGIGEGYIFSTTPNSNPALSNINLNMWKRRHCGSTAGGALTPIGTIGGGSGGATDMTATNALLTSIQTNTAGLVSPGAIDVKIVSGGVGGVATDMTATNQLLTGIQGSLGTGLDTGDISVPDVSGIGAGLDASLSEVGVNPDGVGGVREKLNQSFEFKGKVGKSSFQEIFETHRTAWRSSSSSNSLFSWINSLNANFSSGLPFFNFNLPWVNVNRNIDLNDYSILFDMFRICVLFTATIISYRIVFKG